MAGAEATNIILILSLTDRGFALSETPHSLRFLTMASILRSISSLAILPLLLASDRGLEFLLWVAPQKARVNLPMPCGVCNPVTYTVSARQMPTITDAPAAERLSKTHEL